MSLNNFRIHKEVFLNQVFGLTIGYILTKYVTVILAESGYFNSIILSLLITFMFFSSGYVRSYIIRHLFRRGEILKDQKINKKVIHLESLSNQIFGLVFGFCLTNFFTIPLVESKMYDDDVISVIVTSIFFVVSYIRTYSIRYVFKLKGH